MRTGSIYIIRNTVNKKVYIGQTTMTVHDRFITHMKPSTLKLKRNYKLYNAVQKYGREVFYVETLEENIPLDSINDREIFYIALYDSYNNGYNSTKGGDGRIFNKLDNEDDIIRLAESGVSAQKIAERFHVHRATIQRTLHRVGIYTSKKVPEKELLEMFERDIPIKDIAAHFGVDDYSITRRLKTFGKQRYKTRFSTRNSDEIAEEIRQDYEGQMTIENICQKYNISKSTFYRISKKYQFSIRPQIYTSKKNCHEQ